MKIKICGLTQPGEASYLNENGADFAGFVLFFPKSKRHVTCAQARAIFEQLIPSIRKVAVTVSPSAAELREIEETGFDFVQIHGDFPPKRLSETKLPVLRAFNAGNIAEYALWRDQPQVTGFLFDAAEPGSGKTFDWSSLSAIDHNEKLFILAGGLTPENVASAIEAVHPDMVDVSSGVEYGDGRPGKDPEKVAAFIRAARSVEK